MKKPNSTFRNDLIEHPELDLRQTQIIQHLLSNPQDVLTIKAHQRLNKLAYQTARQDLRDLVEKKWLKSIKKGKAFYFVSADNFIEKIEAKQESRQSSD